MDRTICANESSRGRRFFRQSRPDRCVGLPGEVRTPATRSRAEGATARLAGRSAPPPGGLTRRFPVAAPSLRGSVELDVFLNYKNLWPGGFPRTPARHLGRGLARGPRPERTAGRGAARTPGPVGHCGWGSEGAQPPASLPQGTRECGHGGYAGLATLAWLKPALRTPAKTLPRAARDGGGRAIAKQSSSAS